MAVGSVSSYTNFSTLKLFLNYEYRQNCQEFIHSFFPLERCQQWKKLSLTSATAAVSYYLSCQNSTLGTQAKNLPLIQQIFAFIGCFSDFPTINLIKVTFKSQKNGERRNSFVRLIMHDFFPRFAADNGGLIPQ